MSSTQEVMFFTWCTKLGGGWIACETARSTVNNKCSEFNFSFFKGGTGFGRITSLAWAGTDGTASIGIHIHSFKALLAEGALLGTGLTATHTGDTGTIIWNPKAIHTIVTNCILKTPLAVGWAEGTSFVFKEITIGTLIAHGCLVSSTNLAIGIITEYTISVFSIQGVRREARFAIAWIVVRACLAGIQTLNTLIVEVEVVRCFAGQARGSAAIIAFRTRVITSNTSMIID